MSIYSFAQQIFEQKNGRPKPPVLLQIDVTDTSTKFTREGYVRVSKVVPKAVAVIFKHNVFYVTLAHDFE